ncbi:MAG: hypothetical protein WA782_12410 [Sulfitobacter sp.]
MQDKVYLAALETAWITGTFGYFGFIRRELKMLNGSTGSAARRDRLLETAYPAG